MPNPSTIAMEEEYAAEAPKKTAAEVIRALQEAASKAVQTVMCRSFNEGVEAGRRQAFAEVQALVNEGGFFSYKEVEEHLGELLEYLELLATPEEDEDEEEE